MSMKCETCGKRPLKCSGFTTHTHFEAAIEQLEGMISSGEMENIDDNKIDRTYLCKECGGKWQLVAPDNAFRGSLRYISSMSQKIDLILSKRTSLTRR